MTFISRIKRLFTHDGRKPTILSIKDMMSMSDEEIGREFSKCGEWRIPNYSYRESAFENIFVMEFFIGLISLIVLLGGWFMTIFFSVSHLLFIGAGLILALSIIIMCLDGYLSSRTYDYAKKQYDKYYKFNVLSPDGYRSGVFESFVKSLRVEDLNFNGSLYRYILNICKAVNRYHGYHDDGTGKIYKDHREKYDYQYSYEDIGRMLKLMLPVAYLKQRTNFSEKSFNELDSQIGLTSKLLKFNDDIEQQREEKTEQEQIQRKIEEEEKRREQEQETHAAISDFISLGQESEQMKDNPDYARIEDTSKRLNESKDSLVEKVAKTADNG